tara:strand:+ start:3783 stop:4055 length:273 start_codon:yes stop_codon:yes gene_type:complete
MLKRTINIFFLILALISFFLITKYYFSEKNILSTNKSRTSYSLKLYENNEHLPLLKNDTNNIIIYKDELEEFKKKRKKRFWEKLISNKNE